jgi:hypothetical protein
MTALVLLGVALLALAIGKRVEDHRVRLEHARVVVRRTR